MKGISIIGPGRLGGAIALAIDRRGGRIESIVYRNRDSANKIREAIQHSEPAFIPFEEVSSIDASIILITSADPEIAGIANVIAKFIRPGTIVLHTSGSLSSDVLINVKSAGGVTGSMHPLVSVSDAFLGAERFAGVYFCIEGEAEAAAAATSLAISLGGKAFSIPTHSKALYHAAAVTASGHLVAVTDVAIEMLSACGLDAAAGRETLLPLILSSVENLRTQAPAQALT